jgi:hypothetical protein
LPAFPKGLPERVIAPRELAYARAGGKIVGYTMDLVAHSQALMRYSDRGWRMTGVDPQSVAAIFGDLHASLKTIHQTGLVIGDFNDLNVLVKNASAYLIDADSWQFGRFVCSVFTPRFTDPLLLDRNQQLVKPFNRNSDWYAFAVMLIQSLLYVEPYGGVWRPPKGIRPAQAERQQKRITVFHPEVRYPKPALPFDRLPDELLDQFQRTFSRDERGVFPLSLVQNLRWTKCRQCGIEHARAVCPVCALVPAAAVKATVTRRGKVTATRIFSNRGVVLAAAAQKGTLNWLYFQAGQFRREDHSVVLTGPADPLLRYRLAGKSTLVAKGTRAVVITPGKQNQTIEVDNYANWPQIDANNHNYYWANQGQLLMGGQWGPQTIGQVLVNQTLFWVGPSFGFGFYRYGEAYQGFVFDAKEPGINDRVTLPRFNGHLIDASAVFTSKLCWFFWVIQEQKQIVNRALVVDCNGQIVATAQTEAGDGSWLSSIHGLAAGGNFVLAATDDGIVRAEINGGGISATQTFPDTEPFVDAASQLFVADDGLYAVTRKEITRLSIA